MPIVAFTDPQGALGRRLSALANDQGAMNGDEPLEFRPLDGLQPAELDAALKGADVLAHLLASTPATPTGATTDVSTTRRVLEAATRAGVDHVVLVSDATVYGAWANNPVPLTDDAVVRPNPGFTFAAERAELERLAAEWRAARPQATLTTLRPVRTPGRADWLLGALAPGRAVPEGGDEPPAQFLDLGDLAAAVVVACRQRLNGAFNVAPKGSISGEDMRALTGAVARVRLPARLLDRLTRWRFRSGLGSTPPELVPYTLHPWVVASDRLREAGWQPQVTNEEACVAAHGVGPFAGMSPQRRQELALGAAVAGIVAGVTAAVLVVRRLFGSRGSNGAN